jgi:hypothetical protein
MQRKWLTVTNVIILIILTLILLYIVLNFSLGESVVNSSECVDVNNVASLVYSSCYDAYSKNIFLEVRRSFDTYRLRGLDISFFDFSQKVFPLKNIPDNNGSKSYKIPAEKNPQNIDVSLKVIKDFSAPICEEPRRVAVKYCPAGYQEDGVNVSINPFGTDLDDVISVEATSKQDSDVFSLDLVDKERIWRSKCESRWKCSPWDVCEGGVQRRTCEDKNECFIPTAAPETAKYCDGTCVEEWECEWTKCSGGVTSPNCKDLNRCGTSYDIPRELKCDTQGSCTPDIKCEAWSECEVDYDFKDLLVGDISSLQGSKSRVCRDSSSCTDPIFETRSCSVNADVYTGRFRKCGVDYVGVYNKLNNDLIARIEEGTEKSPHLNIILGEADDSYCDYCSDGFMSGDETGVDCGGSCGACDDKYRVTLFKKKTVMSKISDWIKRILT